jgi:formyl-CoA transferase
VQASLLQSGLGLMDFQAARFLVDGEVPAQVGNDHPTGMPTSAYATADGHVNLGAGGEAMWVKLCEVLERPALATDPRFARGPERSRNRQALNAELGAIFRTRTSGEWIDRLNAAGVPCGPIYRVDEVFRDPQVVAGGMAATVQHDMRGPIEVLAPTVTLSRTPGRLERSLPAVGQDTDDVLAELGYDTDAIAHLRRDGVI